MAAQPRSLLPSKAPSSAPRPPSVEASTIGGTCVNIGCVPSKTLIRAAEICYHAAYPHFEGLTACPPPKDWQRVVQQKDEMVAALRQGKYVDVAKAYPSITTLKGRAELTGGPRLTVNGTAYEPAKVIVATGSHPWAPPIPGLVEAGFLDSTDALSLPALPPSLIVIGGGAIRPRTRATLRSLWGQGHGAGGGSPPRPT